jgi:hypothetical protein
MTSPKNTGGQFIRLHDSITLLYPTHACRIKIRELEYNLKIFIFLLFQLTSSTEACDFYPGWDGLGSTLDGLELFSMP